MGKGGDCGLSGQELLGAGCYGGTHGRHDFVDVIAFIVAGNCFDPSGSFLGLGNFAVSERAYRLEFFQTDLAACCLGFLMDGSAHLLVKWVRTLSISDNFIGFAASA